MSNRWTKVTKAKPCPICGHGDWCKVSPDGTRVLCGRVEQGSTCKAKAGGGFFHDLGSKSAARAKAARPAATKTAGDGGTVYRELPAIIDAIAKQVKGRFVASWAYHCRDGGEALKVLRFETAAGKQYRPIHRSKAGWRMGDPSGRLPLYRLPELPADGPVFVAEGEKAADAVARLGLAATTSAHGAAAADKSDWTPLAGREVVILPDADEPGRHYARDVAKQVVVLDPPGRVRTVELPDLPEGGDAVEFIAARAGRDPATIRAEIEVLAAAAPVQTASELVGGPKLLCLADVEPRPIEWLWPGRIALGRVSLLVGAPGLGKSFLTTDMAARVSTGTPWPDAADCPRGSVILVSAEDDPHDTIRPRLDAHYADVRRVHLLSAVHFFDHDAKRHERTFTLADVNALEAALRQHRDCKLLVVDPIGSYLGGDTDSHRDNEVRGVLAPVARLAEQYGPAVLIVAHRRKGSGSSADELAMGSRAFTGLARTVWHLAKDKADPRRRLLLPGKNNLAPEGYGLAFTIAGDPPQLQWERDPVQMTADEALAVENGGDDASGPGRPSTERDAAVDWLTAELADLQPHAAADLQRDAKAAGLVWRTVQRAADDIGVKRERCGFGGHFTWRLPKPGNLTPFVHPRRADAAIRATTSENDDSGTNGTNEGCPGKTGGSEAPPVQPCHNGTLGTHDEPRERGAL